MRGLIIGLVIVGAVTALLYFAGRAHAPAFETRDLSSLIYMMLALLLVGGGVFGLRQSAQAPNANKFVYLLIWGGVIGLIVLIYKAAQFWGGVGALVS